MNAVHCVGRLVRVEPNDLLETDTWAAVVAVDEKRDALALELREPLTIGTTRFAHAVAHARYEGSSVLDICGGKPTVCSVTFVPIERFRPNDPCDTSWWRGGPAAIAKVFG